MVDFKLRDLEFKAPNIRTEKDMLAAATELGKNQPTDQSVFFRVGAFCYHCGTLEREGKVNIKVDPATIFNAYDESYRSSSNGFRKPLEDSTRIAWVSAFGHFVKAGKWTAYPVEMRSIVERVFAIETGSFTSRASVLNKVMTKYDKTPPTDADLELIINPPKKAKDNPLGDFAKRMITRFADKAMEKNDPTVMAMIKTEARFIKAFLDVRKALDELDRCATSSSVSGMSLEAQLKVLNNVIEETEKPTTTP